MPLDEKIRNDIWCSHAKFQEFIMYRDEDMNLSLFFFYEFYTLQEQELGKIAYMKDVVSDGGIPTKLNSYFSDLYFIFYKFSNFKNEQV
jgi:hypothetical protein